MTSRHLTRRTFLVASGLGTESCARLKRERCVRARVGTVVPVTGDADFIAGHSYYALATRDVLEP